MVDDDKKISTQQRHRLKQFLKTIENIKGRHTELVSVYVPQGYELSKITNHLQQEQGTASNIKSKSTRDNVIAALEKMIQHLKLFKKTPENGLMAFAGNVAEREGQQDYQVWSIEPPLPLKQRIYRCDKEFVLDGLRAMVEDENIFGLVVMDRREGTIALLRGKSIIPLVNTESMVPGKFRAGGQSAARFARNRELAAKEFYKKIGDYMKDQFLFLKELKGIIIGGPGPTKYEFVDGNYITADVKNKIIAVKDVTYTGEFGLQELLERSQDVLANEGVADEKKAVQQFLNLLAKRPHMVTYGKADTLKQVQMGTAETVLVSESFDEETIALFEQEAEKMGTKILLISIETREGVQLKELGKVAAILRYEVHADT